MNSNSPLRLFTLEVNTETKSITPHVRYISPDNVLKDLYRILNCALVTCIEIEVNGKLFDVWSDDDLIIFGSLAFAKTDDDGKLVGLSHEDVHLLWDFSIVHLLQI